MLLKEAAEDFSGLTRAVKSLIEKAQDKLDNGPEAVLEDESLNF